MQLVHTSDDMNKEYVTVNCVYMFDRMRGEVTSPDPGV